MKTYLLALASAAMAWLGCVPLLTQYEQCMGSADMIASDNERAVARSRCSLARETITGVEYAGVGPKVEVSLKPPASGPPQWTCAAIAGTYIDASAASRGDLEVIRAERSGGTKAQAQNVFLDLAFALEKFAVAHGKTMADLLPEPRVADALAKDGTHYRKDSGTYHRCWYRDHVHKDVAYWPPATWPRKPAPIASKVGAPLTGASGLRWDPDAAIQKLDPGFCRQWDRELKSFGSIPRANASGTRFDCFRTLSYKPIIETSDGKEYGTLSSKSASENGLCGPMTNAHSGIDASLRASVGDKILVVDYSGECVPE